MEQVKSNIAFWRGWTLERFGEGNFNQIFRVVEDYLFDKYKQRIEDMQ
jgi:hypothetical protein